MLLRLFLLFTVVPLIELAILIKLGQMFGLLHTVALVIITGFLGAWLAREQGLKVISEMQRSLGEGKTPTDPLIEGALLLVAAALLVTPGVITDVVGFLLVIPPTRKGLRDLLKKYFETKINEGAYAHYQHRQGGSFFFFSSSGGFRPPHGPQGHHDPRYRVTPDDDDDDDDRPPKVIDV